MRPLVRSVTWATLCLACLASQSDATESSAMNVGHLVQDAKLRWDQASSNFYDAAFFGDGVQGGTVLRDDQNASAIRLLLGHYQAITYRMVPRWEYCVSRVYAGNVIIKPRGTADSQPVEMDLWNGRVAGEIRTELGTVTWRALADRRNNTLLVIASGVKGEIEPSISIREEWGITARFHNETKPLEEIAEYVPPKPVRKRDGDIDLAIQEMNSRGAHVLAALETKTPAGETALIVAIGTSDAADTKEAARLAQLDAVSRVRATVREGIERVEDRHRAWWRDYWGLAAIEIPDDPYWQRFWYVQLYKFASASSETAPLVIDTCGPWIWGSNWAAIWWNLNVQLSYMPAYSSNRLGVGQSLINGLERIYKSGALRANAGTSPGIAIGRSTDYLGFGSWGEEFGNLTWTLHGVWRHWAYSQDPRIAQRLYPMLKESVEYMQAQLEEGSDGMLHMKPSRSPEFTDELLSDANYSLMILDWGLRALLDLGVRAGASQAELNAWRDCLRRLPAFPADARGYRVSAEQSFDHSHRHYSHLLAIYPLHTVRATDGPMTERGIRRSIDTFLSLEGGHVGYTYTGGSAMLSSLGEGNRALDTLDRLKTWLTPNTMYAESSPVIETPLSAVESINYMLLQSWGGEIWVFPAIPDRWKTARFEDLRAEGAFLVSAQWSENQVSAVRVHSEAGRECRLRSPWPGSEVRVTDNSGRVLAVRLDGETIVFETERGATYHVGPTSADL